MNFTLKPTCLFIGAVLLLSACSQDDMLTTAITGEGNRIIFRTSLPEPATRAEVITTNKLPYFRVTAFDHVDEDTLFADAEIKVIAGKEYQSSPNCMWPIEGKESNKVSFFAFYPGLEKLGKYAKLPDKLTAGSLDYKLTGFSVAPDIADQVDFIAAYASGTMAENQYSGIKLSFLHQLSRIEVKAWGAHKSCDIEIAGVRIGGVYLEGTFNFPTNNGFGTWPDIDKFEKKKVEYIYGVGDRIVTLKNKKEATATSSKKGAVSIMGNALPGGNNAMLIPVASQAWDHANDRTNAKKGMYISVLLRIIDTTPTAGITPANKQRYPYSDFHFSQGEDALKIPRVYLAVNKQTDTISRRLYKKGESYDINDENYFTDSGCTKLYAVPAYEVVKEFGWAAVPVTGEWNPGNIYTYTFDYTVGIGLHDPEVTTSAPKAGDPIISDQVGMFVTVEEWKPSTDTDNTSFEVPGS